MYVPPMRLTSKRQVAASFSDMTLKHPHAQLGPCERTDLPQSQVAAIDAKTAQAMRKVNLKPFVATSRKWTRWRHDFEVAMLGAAIPESHWVAVLPSHLGDTARDVYEELTGARRGCQTIPWTELVELFEAHFQEKIN